MRIVAIIQARMGSSRFPGKVLKELGGVPLLWHTTQRIRRVTRIDDMVLATSDSEKDEPLVDFADREGLTLFRGSEQDVLERYYLAARKMEAEVIVRITGDCPFIDIEVTDKIVERFMRGEADYCSNTLERRYPIGTDTEVFSRAVLETALKEATLREDREHVTPYIYNNRNRFRCKNVGNTSDLSYIRHCVDFEEDYLFVKALFGDLGGTNIFFSTTDVERLIAKKPWLLEINRQRAGE